MIKPGYPYSAAEVLAHEAPMRLIDAIEDYGPDWVTVRVDITNDSMFCTGGAVPGWVGVEYMAQAAAAYSGIEQIQKGGKPTIGLLLGMREYRCRVPHFAAGDVLKVTASVSFRDERDLVLFDCTIRRGDERLAESAIKAYRPRRLEDFL